VIDDKPGEVIGVLPSSFKFLRTRPDILLPMPLQVNALRGISFGFQALAGLKPGVTLAQANADVARLISLGTRLLPFLVVVRADTTVAELTRSVQQPIWSVDPQQPIANVRMMEEIVTTPWARSASIQRCSARWRLLRSCSRQ
jgi:hypothetical protein